MQQVVAEKNSLSLVVNRHGMKEAVAREVEPAHVYGKFVRKCIVSKLIGVLVRITVQLLHVRSVTCFRVHNADQRFRHVGCKIS